MKSIKIKHQNHLIIGIIGALKTSVLGQGVRELHDIEIHRGHYDTQIEFTRKDGNEIQPIDFFMLGYFVGRDYES